MVNQPQALRPDQHVGVARRAVNVGDIGVEPDDAGGQGRVERRGRGGADGGDVLVRDQPNVRTLLFVERHR
ncbi:MAG: hypothetical protein ACRDHW_14860, partial [Ktedonobacteraceae bacterium]